MLYVSIKEILKSPGLWKDFDYEGPLEIEGAELDGPVDVHLRLSNAGSRIVVQGTIGLTALLSCSRCAESFPQPLELDIDDSFVPEGSPEAMAEGVDVLNILTFVDDRVVFDELIRQEVVAAEPMQPVCKEDCKGLCDQCGADLNKGRCTCEPEGFDPRWAPLMKLKGANGKKESIS
ncbi:MAG: DUF177 domain-containing protein [Vulcanimicrobiota bacterium]